MNELWIAVLIAVYLPDVSGGNVLRVMPVSGESGDDAVVKVRPAAENGGEVSAVGECQSSPTVFLHSHCR